MTAEGKWTYYSIRRFEREREANKGSPFASSYYANCILNYAEAMRLVWC